MQEGLFQVGVKALIRDSEGRVLLLRDVHHADGYWDLPGGRMGRDETFGETLKRELKEEIGIDIFDTVGHVMTVLSNKKIQIATAVVGLVLVVYSVQTADDVMSLEPGVVCEWTEIEVAATRLADKYSEEFCTTVRSLT